MDWSKSGFPALSDESTSENLSSESWISDRVRTLVNEQWLSERTPMMRAFIKAKLVIRAAVESLVEELEPVSVVL